MQPSSTAHQLIADNLAYMSSLAFGCYNEFDLAGVVSYRDVLAFARTGLVESATRFSREKAGHNGATFKTFSYRRVRGAIIDGVRKAARSRVTYAKSKEASDAAFNGTAGGDAMPLGLSDQTDIDVDTLPAPLSMPADLAIDQHRLRAKVLAAIRQLPELDRNVTRLFFYEGLELARISERLGISRSYCCRVHWRAIRSLSSALTDLAADHGVEDVAR